MTAPRLPEPPVPAATPPHPVTWGGRTSVAAFAMSGAVYIPRPSKPAVKAEGAA